MVEQILGFACACTDFVHLLEFYTQIILLRCFINFLIYFFSEYGRFFLEFALFLQQVEIKKASRKVSSS